MEQKTRRPDRRILKTKRAIKKAFVKLLLTKDYNKITIKDIATEADVDRKTVYNYYSGIHEIREEIENEIVKSMDDSISQFEHMDACAHATKIFSALTTIINQNSELFGYLFKSDNNTQIVRKIIFYVEDYVYRVLKDSSLNYLGQDKLHFMSNFIAGGAIVVYQDWFNSDRKTPLVKLSDDLTNVSRAVFASFKEQKAEL